ncbi:hypothetical protein ACTXL6_00230 [Brachybacterium tyrofermentans]|uniref:hypothetical protein n=1 Tax=Brachybacterium tyrofermentans TaxID=47848 RepID=UPI003FD4DB60
MTAALAWSTFLIAFWTLVPQTLSIHRYRHEPEALRGVSMLSLSVIVVDYIGWSAYGILTAAWALWIPSVIGAVLTFVTIVLLLHVRSRRPSGAPGGPSHRGVVTPTGTAQTLQEERP